MPSRYILEKYLKRKNNNEDEEILHITQSINIYWVRKFRGIIFRNHEF